MSIKFFKIPFVIAFLILSLFQAKAQRVSSEKKKAQDIFTFTGYVTWEKEEMIETITIGMLKGRSRLVNELKNVTKDGYQNGVQVEVIRFNRIEDIKFTHVLFVDSTENLEIAKIVNKIKGANTLLITENCREKKSIMFNMVDRPDKISVEYNRENILAARFKLLKDIATSGYFEITTKVLLDESDKNLQNEKQINLQQKEEIKKQQKEIDAQTEKIAVQIKQINESQAKIDAQKRELGQLTERTRNQQRDLLAKQEILNKQKDDIKIQEEKIKLQIEKVTSQEKILSEQNEKIKNRQKTIDEQNAEIVKQYMTIKIKDNLILVFVVFLFIISIMLFFIFRGYRRKRKDNILLAKQKQEITTQSQELEIFNKELEKLSIVASETSSAVAIMDAKGNYEWINPGFTRMYGYTFQLLKNELDENIIGASNNPEIESIINKAIQGKKPIIYESPVKTRNGDQKWAQSTLTPILDENKEIVKLVLIDSDITKIKEAEAEIIKRNKMITEQAKQLELTNKELEKLSLVASRTDNSVIIARPDGELEWVNDGFSRMLGISFEEFKDIYGTNLFTTSLNPNLREMVEEGIQEKKSVVYTARTLTKKKRAIWIQTTLTPIFDNQGNLTRYIAIDADVTHLKHAEEEIAKQKEKIMDSILYAKRIQNAVLPPEDLFEKLLPEHFVLFIPKDIVSGDFYWAHEIGNKIVIAAADCTGHGVPGAFMSLLGITFLSEIVANLEPEILKPFIVLNQLRDNIKNSLRQTGKEGEAKDGMDIALCIYDKSLKQMEFSGANNSLLVVRNNQIIEYVADDMPIGIFYKEKDLFSNHRFLVEPGDTFYIFSDGYADQFGGDKGRKFMYRRFKELVLELNNLPMVDQKDKLEETFYEWKGGYRQIDDILVIGFKI